MQASYEQRSKALLKVSNVINNTNAPTVFLTDGGINDANRILCEFHKQAVTEANKARDIEQDVVTQLSGLRADLGQKIKEIKSLAGDFKNTVEKEKAATRKVVNLLQESLSAAEQDPHDAVGRDDPYIIRMNVDRQVERQLDEENYLHRAYLNLEGSGRELESIVVGEIQKAYNALAGIMKREADSAYDAIEQLRNGPITMPKDHEWTTFVDRDPHMVSPNVSLRKIEELQYPGKNHPAAAEVRAGMLERKSKYLKSYTPGWYVMFSLPPKLACLIPNTIRYVLSPTHLHEFKSADRIHSQPPVMSLFLGDQKLGSHSQPASSSHKFMLKGRQTGSMHRGHTWVFRAESYDTMLAWYDDIKSLTETTTEERRAFVRKHARSFSGGSTVASSVSGESAMEEDEADQVPYSASESMNASKELDGNVGDATGEKSGQHPPLQKRPNPGGRFPSDLQVPYFSQEDRQRAHSPSSGDSNNDEAGEQRDLSMTSGVLTGFEGTQAAMGHVSPTGGARTMTKHDENEHMKQPPLDARDTDNVPVQHPPQPPVANAPDLDSPSMSQRPKTQAKLGIPIQRYDSYNASGTWLASGTVSAGAGTAAAATTYAAEKGARRKNERGKGWPEQGQPLPKTTVVEAANGERHDETDMGLGSLAMAQSAAPMGVSGSGVSAGGKSSRQTMPMEQPRVRSHGQEKETASPALNTLSNSSTAPDQTPNGTHPFVLPSSSRAGDPKSQFSVPSEPIPTSGPVTVGAAVPAVDGRHTVYDTDPVSGRPNARATGSMFPAVLRHNADVSVSRLHVPGEFCE